MVDAVRCMVEVQKVGARWRHAFRIGVNLGDSIIDNDDIFGDDVNIAARLQEIAAPGGVCVSKQVHEDVRDQLQITFVDGGLRTLKNIARPGSGLALDSFCPLTMARREEPPHDSGGAVRPLPFENQSVATRLNAACRLQGAARQGIWTSTDLSGPRKYCRSNRLQVSVLIRRRS